MIAALQQVKPKSKTQQGEQILVPNEPIWPLTVSQYHTMIETGILTEDDPVELLEGWLVYKMPKNPEHIFVARETSDALKAIVPSGWYINVQDPVTMETSEPEPDIVVIRGTRRDFSRQTPTAKDVSLLVEVSEATLGRDRGTKKRVYARSGIPIYWIINLLDNQIEVYTIPTNDGEGADYQSQQIFTVNEKVPVILDDQELGLLSVRDLMP